MSEFWSGRKVLVTGGGGFLGTAVRSALSLRGPKEVVAPRSAEFDLRVAGDVDAMVEQHRPDLVVHLAATVGGIGANRARPADLYLDNLLMGTYVIDAARRFDVPKTVVVGTICSYPKFTDVPFHEDSLWQGYPEETNAPYGIAKLAQLVQIQANRAQYGQSAIYLMPTNLYGPGDKFHPAVSHVIPALIKKCVDAVESGDDFIDVWGTGSATREFLYVDDAAEGIVAAAERYDGDDPVNLGTERGTPDPRSGRDDRRAHRVRGRAAVGRDQARRAAAPSGRPVTGPRAVRLRGPRPLRGRPARDHRLVPGQPRRRRSPRPLIHPFWLHSGASETPASSRSEVRRADGRALEPRQSGTASNSRKKSMVGTRPSRSGTFGSQPEQLARPGDVGASLRRVVDGERRRHDLGGRAGHLDDDLGQLADRELARVADVHRIVLVGVEQGEDARHGVVDVAEAAGLAAVAVDRDRRRPTAPAR